MNYYCSNLLNIRNLQEQVKKALCYQKFFWPFTVWINCSSDLKNIASSRPSASNFKSFSRSLEHFFLTVGRNNFGNKIPLSKERCKNTRIWLQAEPFQQTKPCVNWVHNMMWSQSRYTVLQYMAFFTVWAARAVIKISSILLKVASF